MAQLPGVFFSFSTLLVLAAALLDIFANMFLAASRGFKKIFYGVASFVLIGLAFYCLSLAVENIDLAVGYALWGSFGLIGTCLGGWLMFNQRPNFYAFLGIGVQILGIILLYMN